MSCLSVDSSVYFEACQLIALLLYFIFAYFFHFYIRILIATKSNSDILLYYNNVVNQVYAYFVTFNTIRRKKTFKEESMELSHSILFDKIIEKKITHS